MIGPRTEAIPQIPPMKPCQYPRDLRGVMSADMSVKSTLILLLALPTTMFLVQSARYRRRFDTSTHDMPMMVPPPKPLKARQTMSLDFQRRSYRRECATYQVMFLAAPQRAEKMTKSRMAMYSNGFLPTISDTRPLTGARSVIARVYAYRVSLTLSRQWATAHRPDP
jgi:hypothetical protein